MEKNENEIAPPIVDSLGMTVSPPPAMPRLVMSTPVRDHGVTKFIRPPEELDVTDLMTKMYDYFTRRPINTTDISYTEPPMTEDDLDEESSIFGIVRPPKPAPVPQVDIVSWEDFCLGYGITKRKLFAIASVVPQMQELVEFCNQSIKRCLVIGGLTETFNPSFAKFIAINETDMKEDGDAGKIKDTLSSILERIEENGEEAKREMKVAKERAKRGEMIVVESESVVRASPLSGIDPTDIDFS